MHDRPKQSSRSIRKDTNLGIGSTGPLQETNPQKELCRTHLPRDKGTHVPERQGKTTGSVKHQPSRDELLQEVEEPNPKNLREDKKKWADNMINKSEQGKSTWNLVNKITGRKQSNPINKIQHNGIILTKDKEIATSINNQLISKITTLKQSLNNPSNNNQTQDIIHHLRATPTLNIPTQHMLTITTPQLNTIIKQLKNSNATGMDGISTKVIKDAYPTIHHIILHVINLSLATGIFPRTYKHTKIIPVLKPNKNPLEASNYRPISNLKILAKILEECGFSQIIEHNRVNNLNNKNQHGGRPNHSTNSCLIEINEEIQEAKENKLTTAILAIDLSAAYDMVRHDVLIEKLRIKNLSKLSLNWAQSFLKDRYQACEINGNTSELQWSGNIGVVQGGKASGALFNIYVDDLPNVVNQNKPAKNIKETTAQLFVDDTTILIKANNKIELEAKIQIEYNAIERYLLDHGMKINYDKTQMMIVNGSRTMRETELNASGSIISHQRELKLLGITFSENLKFTKHSENISASINRTTAIIKPLQPYFSKTKISQIVGSLVNSTIAYCAPLWGNAKGSNTTQVQKCQTRILRRIDNKKKVEAKNTNRQTLFEKYKWQNTEQIIEKATLNLTAKALRNESSEGLNKMFKVSKPKLPRGEPYQIIHHKGPNQKKDIDFSSRATTAYNSAPKELRNPNLSSKQTKHKIKNYTNTTHHLKTHNQNPSTKNKTT